MTHKKPNRQENTHTHTHKKKDYPYHRPLIKKKINVLKRTNVCIAYEAANTLYNRLQDTQEVQNKFQKVVSINSHTEHVMPHT